MSRRDTWTGDHHWIPRRGDWAEDYPQLWDALYADSTTFLEHDEHVQAHRDTREYGPAGAQSLCWLRRISR